MRSLFLIAMMLLCRVMFISATDVTYTFKGRAIVNWNENEIVGFYTTDGNRLRTTVYSLDASDKHKVELTGNGWYMTPNSTYYGYYPYNSNYVINGNVMTALPMTYEGQTQSANDNTSHLAAYDYMFTQATTTESEADFHFSHYGSVIRFACYVPEKKTFSSLEISSKAGDDIFSSAAEMNLTNQTITSTAKSNTATLTLNNITVEDGDSLIAYMMMMPTDLSGQMIQLTLSATDGSSLQTYISGTKIQAEKVYPISIGQHNYYGTGASLTSLSNSEIVNSLSVGIEGNNTTAAIATVKATATDFTPDAENKFQTFPFGDVNYDGVVNVADAEMVIQHYQARTTDELALNTCDVNGDGVINVTDAVGIINIAQQSAVSKEVTTTVDKFMFKPVALVPDETATQYLSVIVLGSRKYSAYCLDIKMPEGLELAYNDEALDVSFGSESIIRTTDGIPTHTLSATYFPVDRVLRLSCMSPTNADFRMASGIVCQIGVKVSETINPDAMGISLSEQCLIVAQGKQYNPAAITDTGVTIATTAVNGVREAADGMDENRYAINGVVIGTPKGGQLYIQNGKKIVNR